MEKVTFEQLKKNRNDSSIIRGTSRNGKNDKSARFYHVMTRSWGGEAIFYSDTGLYRNRLLCRLCESYGITLIFSVTMPNHTHDVFMTERWEDLSTVIRILNTQLGHFIRTNAKKKYLKGMKVFDPHTLYVAIKDIASLIYVGKYIHDNPTYLLEQNRSVPYSCFWIINNSRLPSVGYDESLYSKLFGMTSKALSEFYEHHTKQEVSDYCAMIANTWTKEESDAFFLRK